MYSLGQLGQMNTSPGCYLAASCLLLFVLLRLSSLMVKFVQDLGTMLVGTRDKKEWNRLPPGTMGFPFIGETFSFLLKGSQFYHEKMQKYGTIYKTHLLGKPTVRVIGAEHVQKIVLGVNDIVTPLWPTSTRLLLGQGSITQSTGIIHRIRRKHMMVAFKQDALSDYVSVLQEKICNAVTTWCNKGNILVYPECTQMTFIAATKLMLGLEVDSVKGREMSSIFLDYLENIMSIPLDVPGFGFHRGMQAKRRLIQELRQLIAHNKKHGSCVPTPVMDSYSLACERLGTDDEMEVSEGMLDILFAGHETVASVTTSAVMLLGKHKEVVEKIREELIENNIACDSEQTFYDLSYQKIGELKYLHYVVKEVLRLCPPVGGGFRKALRDFELGGYLIPKGWMIIYSIRETQMTSSLFPQPEQFIPERWEKLEYQGSGNRFHFLPFGGGARGCIGKAYALLLAKIFVIELVRKCEWTLKNPNPKMRYIPVPVAADHLPVTITRRNF